MVPPGEKLRFSCFPSGLQVLWNGVDRLRHPVLRETQGDDPNVVDRLSEFPIDKISANLIFSRQFTRRHDRPTNPFASSVISASSCSHVSEALVFTTAPTPNVGKTIVPPPLPSTGRYGTSRSRT